MNFKLNDLSNTEIDSYLTRFSKYRGCYSCLRLPRIQEGLYIVNMDIRPHGGGTHWTLVDVEKNRVIYFDPFGLPPNTYTDKWMRSSGKPVYYSNLDYQNVDSHACGYFTIYVAEELLKGRTMESTLNEFTKNTLKNEKKLEHVFIF